MEKIIEKAGKVSVLLEHLTESATLAMARMARELAQQGHHVVSLSLGEPDFNTPDFIKDAARDAMDKNLTHYPPVNGFADVRQAISKKFLRDNELHYLPEQIVISTGAKQSIANTIFALVNPGDEVILPSPYWVSYAELVRVVGGVPVKVPTTVEHDFKMTPHQLRSAITEKSKLMIYSSPCNPTGTLYNQEELESLASVIKEKDELFVISDEIYELIRFSGKTYSMAAVEGMYDRTITINGVSKAFAMTGWRIGYLGAPRWIADACTKMQGQITSGANTIAQMAAKSAVEADPLSVKFMVDTFLRRRDLVYQLLKEIPGLKINLPEGAFYFFIDVSDYFGKKGKDNQTIRNATDLAMYFLETQYLAVVSGEAFGDENCIRISYATSEDLLREAIRRMTLALSDLE